ncbi:MAG: hypothetical protein AAF125_09240 [Chloroflexota bacterium]
MTHLLLDPITLQVYEPHDVWPYEGRPHNEASVTFSRGFRIVQNVSFSNKLIEFQASWPPITIRKGNAVHVTVLYYLFRANVNQVKPHQLRAYAERYFQVRTERPDIRVTRICRKHKAVVPEPKSTPSVIDFPGRVTTGRGVIG